MGGIYLFMGIFLIKNKIRGSIGKKENHLLIFLPLIVAQPFSYSAAVSFFEFFFGWFVENGNGWILIVLQEGSDGVVGVREIMG
jgi:hypothetical protein